MNDTIEQSLIFFDSVEPTETHWLWYPYIPLGKVTIMMGDPGEGKSTLSLAIASAVTQGAQFPDTKTAVHAPEIVLYQNAEDGLADTIIPRVKRLGGNCRGLVTINEMKENADMRSTMLYEVISQMKPKLVILDPLQAYLGEHVDMHRANEIRPVMHYLSMLAEKFGCAIVLIGHMNKKADLKSLYRSIGSIDLTAAARSVLLVGRDPSEPARRVIAQVKNSLAPEGENVAFTINDGVFHFEGVCDVPTERLLSQRERRVTPRDRAAECLTRWLTEHGEISVREIYDMACGEEITKAALLRAKASLGIHAHRQNNQWYWSLPKA
jgi:archaellum biogenesis ATPase FlaH